MICTGGVSAVRILDRPKVEPVCSTLLGHFPSTSNISWRFHKPISAAYLVSPFQDGHALSRQGHKGGPVSCAPVPGVINVHQGITPGGSPKVLSVKALRNTEKKNCRIFLGSFIKLVFKKNSTVTTRYFKIPGFQHKPL